MLADIIYASSSMPGNWGSSFHGTKCNFGPADPIRLCNQSTSTIGERTCTVALFFSVICV